MRLDKGVFSCKKHKKYGQVFYISDSSYETLVVNGVKFNVVET